MLKHKTRSDTSFPVFGHGKELNETVLPTYEDVMRYYLLLQKNIELERNGRGIIKSNKNRQHTSSFQVAVQLFQKDGKELFDVAACKCDFAQCKCDKIHRIPVIEQPFLDDQRNLRLMCIGSVDTLATRAIRRRIIVKSKESSRAAAEKKTSASVSAQCEVNESSSSEIETSDSDNQLPPNKVHCRNQPVGCSTSTFSPTPQNRLRLPSLARISDRYGVSDRAAAALASSVLEDVGLIQSKDKSMVVDRSKLRRERNRTRDQMVKQSQSHVTSLRGLYFDGRKDQTLVITKDGHKFHRKIITEEHISLIQQPESKYIGHISPKGGSAASIAASIVEFLTGHNCKEIIAVGCDGTVVNTGHKGGVIRLLEEELNKPLQWFVCQLHANELLLRHLIQHVDGSKTTGPNTYSGPIGKQLETCEQLNIADFEAIEGEISDMTCSDLSTDQQYLLEICKAVCRGHCPHDLATRQPGKMSHARWLTTANRVLRLYVGTEQPTTELKQLAKFVIKVYARLWFSIKSQSSCKYGGLHVWEMIHCSRYLDESLKQVIDPVIQRNAYFAHPENLLLCMLVDERTYVRELGLRRILKAKKQEVKSSIRRFKIPSLNFNSTDYFDLVHWQNCEVTVPPILTSMSEEQIMSLIAGHAPPLMEFESFPCHTQSVERCVKLVTQSAAAVCGAKSRDGFIRNRIQSRELMPQFETKLQYRTTQP